MDVVVDGKPLTAEDVLRLGRQLEAAMELEEVAAIRLKAESWAEAFRAHRSLTYDELRDVARRAELALSGKPREAGTFAPAAWPDGDPPLVTPALLQILAKDHGVALDAALAAMQPSLLLSPLPLDPWELPAGSTRLGGAPDVPAGWSWPRHAGFPLAFLAQIRLADLAPALPGRGGPQAGTLLFFGDVDASGTAAGADGWHVELLPAGAELAPAAFPTDLYRVCRYAPTVVEPLADITTPDAPDAPAPMPALFADLEVERGNQPLHRVFGFPQPWQGPVLRDGEMLLLQLDSDWRVAAPPNDGFRWDGSGRLYFVIQRADWQAGDFSRVRAEIQTP